jgi:hypothetical protein
MSVVSGGFGRYNSDYTAELRWDFVQRGNENSSAVRVSAIGLTDR